MVLSLLAEMLPTWAISDRVPRRLGQLLELRHDLLNRLVDAPLYRHRVMTGGDDLEALAENGSGKDRRRGGAVAGDVGGLAGDLLDHLRAHVLELVLELDLLGDRHAVLGHVGRAPGFLQHHVAPLGA